MEYKKIKIKSHLQLICMPYSFNEMDRLKKVNKPELLKKHNQIIKLLTGNKLSQ